MPTKMLKYHNIYLMSCLRWWAKKNLPTLPDDLNLETEFFEKTRFLI
ncbi:MAG: hypothetical protein KAI83_14060 [Thiomargarita sp.]|nr:hypothetical protein [Thiomargarita sp.]